jgi:hypothetical protein
MICQVIVYQILRLLVGPSGSSASRVQKTRGGFLPAIEIPNHCLKHFGMIFWATLEANFATFF